MEITQSSSGRKDQRSFFRCQAATKNGRWQALGGLDRKKEEFLPYCKKYGVDLISMIAPTSENRISMIASQAEGFIYVVSSLGVTGTRSEIKTDLDSIVALIRQSAKVPCAIGFGISTPEQVGAYVRSMKAAVRGA